MTDAKRSFYGHVRRTAYDLWRGPDYVENVEKEDENNPLGGLCVLRLAIRKGETAKPMLESRAVYAMLRPDEPKDALLRAIYWDSKTVPYSSNRYDYVPFKIPAKFVQIPFALLQQWIRLLNNLQASIQTSSHEDDSLPICTLRVAPFAIAALLLLSLFQFIREVNSEQFLASMPAF